MLQLQFIRDNREEVINRLAVKNYDAREAVDEIMRLDEERRLNQNEMDTMLAHSNQLAKQIGQLYKEGRTAEADDARNKSTALKDSVKELSTRATDIENDLHELLVKLPNLPGPGITKGKSAEDNTEVYAEGKMPQLSSDALPHWDLASKYDLIDFELGTKITGAGFPVYKGKGARLQRALINFFLDSATQFGYREIQAPSVVNEESGFGTGQLPDKEGQMYHITADNFYLIPTAEVPLTNIFRDEILRVKDLPVKLTGYTPCFRREAGSYGKDVRGLNRLHQFDKVEIVQIQHPDKSYETLEEMKEYVAGLLRELELPFRILRLCGGDMSFASAFTYDFEVYSAAQKRWLEVSSVSNFETFQSNRLKLRFKEGDQKPRLAHTLNGSALALPRIVAALLENNQTEKGVLIPEILRSYTGFNIIN
jgi:seryl-tRNA synthetase